MQSADQKTRLSGAIKVIVIVGYVLAGSFLTLIPLVITSSVVTFKLASTANAYLAGTSASGLGTRLALSQIGILLLCVLAAILCFLVARMLHKRKIGFLQMFHFGMLALTVLLFVTCLLAGGTGRAFLYLFLLLGATVGATIYALRSQRLRAYMGGDEYLYLSPFTKLYLTRFAPDAPGSAFDRNSDTKLADRRDSSAEDVYDRSVDPEDAYDRKLTSDRDSRDAYDRGATSEATVGGRASRNAGTDGAPQRRVPALSFPANHCCVCRHELEEGYAVLFTTENGAEARICEPCCSAISTLAGSDDRSLVKQAIKYFKRYPNVHPAVRRQVGKFVKQGEDFLNEL